jgi:hypothetical protein
MNQPPARDDHANAPLLDARLDRRDADAIAARRDVDSIYLNDSRWWQNASFALPAIVAAIALGIGLVTRIPEAIGFGIFVAVVTAIMGPVVLLTWRSTATSIVLTAGGAFSLHHGKVLHELAWPELRRVEEVEYLGNRRYKLVHGEDERFLTVESEIERAGDLVDRAFALSGLPRRRGEAKP